MRISITGETYCPWTWNENKSGQLTKRSLRVSSMSLFDEMLNSRLFFIPASNVDKVPTSLFVEKSRNLSCLSLPSSSDRPPIP